MVSSFVNMTLFLLLAVLTRSAPIPEPQNHEEIKPPPLNTYIVHADHLAKPSPLSTHEDWYTSMVATHSPRPAVLLYTYDTVMRQITRDKARRMSEAPGVTGVHEDRVLQLLTTRSPGFLGLDPGFGAWKVTDLGDGVIIGFVDTGIWPESRSFNDRGLGPVRPSWKGKCVDAPGFNATSSCNNKIVGAKVFAAGKGAMRRTPRDKDGHGTHVASTAAGSEVRNIGIGMFARGTARGVAPKARIATYKAASDTPITDVVAAVDAAVKDGVDIISLGFYDLSPFHNDSFAIAVFGADRKGVFVVLAGGNTGPAASSVINVAPWMTTVGAGTVDRLFPVGLKLGDGTVITGQALYNKTTKSTMTPLLSVSCSQPLTPDKIRGGIVICVDGSASQVEVRDAGGAGQIIIETWNWNIGGTEAGVFDTPAVVLSRAAGKHLRAYMDSVPFPVASLSFTCETVIGENRSPLVVSFSSRGPNPVVPELLKPDVIAPGQNVLAAWKGGYIMESGTYVAPIRHHAAVWTRGTRGYTKYVGDTRVPAYPDF
nr:unnamed protein product [Digitaria exilis]